MSDVRFPMRPLSDLVTAIKDGTHGTHLRVAEGVPLLSAKNITANGDIAFDETDDLISEAEYQDLTRSFRLESDDLLLTIVGSLGRRAIYTGQRITFQRSVAYIRPQQRKLRSRFLFHWMGHPAFSAELSRRSNATAQAGLYLGELAKISVPVPDGPEQSEIAQVLDTLDSAIRESEAIIAKLKAIKRGLQHDLLTRGIDANGELRPPQAEAPHLYKDSPLGWIPKEWEATVLGSCTALTSGGTPSRTIPNNWVGNVPLLTPKDMKSFEMSDTIEHINEVAAKTGSKLMPAETVFIVVRGMILAHSFPVVFATRSMAFNQDVKAVTAGAQLCPRFLAYWFVASSDRFLRKVTEATHGTKKLDTESLVNTAIGLPTLTEQNAVVERLASIDRRYADEGAYLAQLSALKCGLMDDLLTGQVRVTGVPIAPQPNERDSDPHTLLSQLCRALYEADRWAAKERRRELFGDAFVPELLLKRVDKVRVEIRKENVSHNAPHLHISHSDKFDASLSLRDFSILAGEIDKRVLRRFLKELMPIQSQLMAIWNELNEEDNSVAAEELISNLDW